MTTIELNSGNTSVFDGVQLAVEVHGARSRLEFYSNADYRRRLAAHVDRLIGEHRLKLLSLDVFDTVLLRDERCEPRRFLDIAARIAAAIGRDQGVEIPGLDLFAARLRATRLSYRLSPMVAGCREGSLREIHEWMCHLSGLPRATAARTIALELEAEIENVSPNPAIGPVLELAERHGIPVVLISDMYMHGEHIAEILWRHFPGAFERESIYSSADFKISKRSGLMFNHVATQCRVAPAACLHIGDSMEADFLAARRHGWHALYLPHTDAERRAIEDDGRRFDQELKALGLVLGSYV